MGDVSPSPIDIDAPIGEVWDLDHGSRAPRRLGLDPPVGCRGLPEGDLKKGSRFRQEMKLKGSAEGEVGGRRVPAPRHARWQGKAAPGAAARISYDLSEHDGKTRFDYENEFELPAGKVGKLAGRAFNAMSGDREAKRSLARLKELLENEPQ